VQQYRKENLIKKIYISIFYKRRCNRTERLRSWVYIGLAVELRKEGENEIREETEGGK
jgi:hypothetical protein